MVTLATEFEQVTSERSTIEAILMADGRSYLKIHTNSNSKPISSPLLTRKRRVQSNMQALMANALQDQSLHGRELLLKASPTPPPHPQTHTSYTCRYWSNLHKCIHTTSFGHFCSIVDVM